MSSLTPSPDVRRLLRGLAANSPDPDGWWSRNTLAAAFPGDFGSLSPQQVAAAGRQATERGMAFSRPCRTHARSWHEWRIRAFGMGLVSDSCIGGGLKWVRGQCPACLSTPAMLGIDGMHIQIRIPPHPLPGYQAVSRAS